MQYFNKFRFATYETIHQRFFCLNNIRNFPFVFCVCLYVLNLFATRFADCRKIFLAFYAKIATSISYYFETHINMRILICELYLPYLI